MRRLSVDERVQHFDDQIDRLAQEIKGEKWSTTLGSRLVDAFLAGKDVSKRLYEQWQRRNSTISAADIDNALRSSNQNFVLKLNSNKNGHLSLDATQKKNVLEKVAVVKLTGGLGTTMKCPFPKALLSVTEDSTLLDMTVSQVKHYNRTYDVNVPLIMMTSFNTHNQLEESIEGLKSKIDIRTFQQSAQPRISADFHTLMPLESAEPSIDDWCPPGHGDFYQSFYQSGMLDEMLDNQIEWAFVSNIDNFGASPDPEIINKIMEMHQNEGVNFVCEVTKKTLADVKGGVFINVDGCMRLLETAQIPEEKKSDFKGTSTFEFFNTNNVWIHLKSLKELIEAKCLETDVIVNPKVHSNNRKIIQLESALSSAIKCFENPMCIEVKRDRFIPIKKCEDLVALNGKLIKPDSNGFAQLTCHNMPLVKLGEYFKNFSEFKKRVPNSINIANLIHLTVNGDVSFGKNVTLIGNVIIIAPKGGSIHIPNGSALENVVITGSLCVDDH